MAGWTIYVIYFEKFCSRRAFPGIGCYILLGIWPSIVVMRARATSVPHYVLEVLVSGAAADYQPVHFDQKTQ
jgi:hypothetical protein